VTPEDRARLETLKLDLEWTAPYVLGAADKARAIRSALAAVDRESRLREALLTWQSHWAYRRSPESAVAAYEKGQAALAEAKAAEPRR